MKKRLLSLILVLVLAFGLCAPAMAASTKTAAITYRAIKIVINDKEITPCDEAGNTVEPFIMNSSGTTYLPLRAIAQALGLDVSWDGPSSTVTLKSGGAVKTGAGSPGSSKGSDNVNITYRDIKVVLDGTALNLVNREGNKVEPFILNANSSVYLPLRVIGEALGLSVAWDGTTSTASLSGSVGGKAVKEVKLSASDVRGEVGGYFRLEAYVAPDDAVNKTVTWSSSDSKVAAVNSDGVVVLRAEGSAEIVATSINGKTAKCLVIVRGEKADDPYDEEVGYSRSEIERLIGYASQTAEAVNDGLASCAKAEEAEHMAPLHVNTAIGHAYDAEKQLKKAGDFLKNGVTLYIEDSNYTTAQDMVKAALAELHSAAQLKADSANASQVHGQVKEKLSKAAEILQRFEAALKGIEIAEPEPEPEPEPDDGKSETTVNGSLLINEKGVKITAKGLETGGLFGPELKLFIENNSGKDLEIQCRDAAVNDFMVDTTMSAAVLNGKKATDKIIFDKASLEENEIKDISKIEFSFHIFEKDKFDTAYLDSEPITIVIEEEPKAELDNVISGIVNGNTNTGDLNDILNGVLGELIGGNGAQPQG